MNPVRRELLKLPGLRQFRLRESVHIYNICQIVRTARVKQSKQGSRVEYLKTFVNAHCLNQHFKKKRRLK